MNQKNTHEPQYRHDSKQQTEQVRAIPVKPSKTQAFGKVTPLCP